jgi:hypothetical protein
MGVNNKMEKNIVLGREMGLCGLGQSAASGSSENAFGFRKRKFEILDWLLKFVSVSRF